MNRAYWRGIATNTLDICASGRYRSPSGDVVIIGDAIAKAVKDTREFAPGDRIDAGQSVRWQPMTTHFEVTTETTLEAAKRLTDDGSHQVLALNFASASNPGGGFKNGSMAQEESLAYASALYPCLEGRQMYAAHRARRGPNHLYEDWLIHTPDVPIFRDDAGNLLEDPWSCGIATSPAPNAKVHIQHARHVVQAQQEIKDALLRRITRLLALARNLGYQRLVLGAWGCGVFGNDPAIVARCFARVFEESFRGTFTHVTFAIKELPDNPTVFTFRRFLPS